MPKSPCGAQILRELLQERDDDEVAPVAIETRTTPAFSSAASGGVPARPTMLTGAAKLRVMAGDGREIGQGEDIDAIGTGGEISLTAPDHLILLRRDIA